MLVQEISIVEKNEINELIEKKNALNNLANNWCCILCVVYKVLVVYNF